MAAQNNKKPATLQPRAKNFNKTNSAPPLSTTSELLKPPRNLNSTSLPRQPPHSLICKIWMHKSSVKRNHCGKYRSAKTRTTQENDGIVVLIQLNYYCLNPPLPKNWYSAQCHPLILEPTDTENIHSKTSNLIRSRKEMSTWDSKN